MRNVHQSLLLSNCQSLFVESLNDLMRALFHSKLGAPKGPVWQERSIDNWGTGIILKLVSCRPAMATCNLDEGQVCFIRTRQQSHPVPTNSFKYLPLNVGNGNFDSVYLSWISKDGDLWKCNLTGTVPIFHRFHILNEGCVCFIRTSQQVHLVSNNLIK